MTYMSGPTDQADRGEIYVSPPDYSILNPLAPGRLNVSVVVPLADAVPRSRPPRRLLRCPGPAAPVARAPAGGIPPRRAGVGAGPARRAGRASAVRRRAARRRLRRLLRSLHRRGHLHGAAERRARGRRRDAALGVGDCSRARAPRYTDQRRAVFDDKERVMRALQLIIRHRVGRQPHRARARAPARAPGSRDGRRRRLRPASRPVAAVPAAVAAVHAGRRDTSPLGPRLGHGLTSRLPGRAGNEDAEPTLFRKGGLHGRRPAAIHRDATVRHRPRGRADHLARSGVRLGAAHHRARRARPGHGQSGRAGLHDAPGPRRVPRPAELSPSSPRPSKISAWIPRSQSRWKPSCAPEGTFSTTMASR